MTDKVNPKHWTQTRSAPIDRTKRVASGATIDSKNIVSGTRTRKDFDYSLVNLPKTNNLTELDEARPSKNVRNDKGLKNITSNMNNMSLAKSPRRRKSLSKDEQKKPVIEAAESDEEMETKTSTTPVKSRANRNSVSRRRSLKQEALAPAVVKALEKLGVEVPSAADGRTYRNKYKLPPAIDIFGQIKWGDHKYKNEKLNVFGLEFVETDIEEASSMSFLAKNPDYYIVADGDVLVVSILSKNADNNDFDVYILDDSEEDLQVEGPFKISTLLADAVVDEEADE
jgi:hypothetical protein